MARTKIRTGHLVAALLPFVEDVTHDMVVEWIHAGRLKATRNPGSKRGWYNIRPASILEFLRDVNISDDEISLIFAYLNLNFGDYLAELRKAENQARSARPMRRAFLRRG